MRYKVNDPFVVYDVIEGEVVIVNLRLGFYYSLRGAGVDIWEAFASGLSEEEVAGKISGCYEGDRQAIERSVGELFERFKKEEFLSPAQEGEVVSPVLTPRLQAVAPEGQRPRFTAPVLEKFTDMEDILLIDPVNDVDEKGWPSRSASPAS